jgi:hypothetical protein
MKRARAKRNTCSLNETRAHKRSTCSVKKRGWTKHVLEHEVSMFAKQKHVFGKRNAFSQNEIGFAVVFKNEKTNRVGVALDTIYLFLGTPKVLRLYRQCQGENSCDSRLERALLNRIAGQICGRVCGLR